MGPSPISMADLAAWLAMEGIEGEERASVILHVRALDSQWLAWAREQQ